MTIPGNDKPDTRYKIGVDWKWARQSDAHVFENFSKCIQSLPNVDIVDISVPELRNDFELIFTLVSVKFSIKVYSQQIKDRLFADEISSFPSVLTICESQTLSQRLRNANVNI